MANDKCARCGEVGDDRRTLWMACLYDMLELKLPFVQKAIQGIVMKHVRDKEIASFKVKVPEFEPIEGAEPRQWNFFTLLVCKDCRGEWMEAIAAWFKAPKARYEPDETHDIPVRKNGRTIFLSREEYDKACVLRAEED